MKIENLTISYNTNTILSDINLEIKPWDFVFLIGKSWCWKTSVINSLIWNLKPSSWNIILDDGSSLYEKDSLEIQMYRKKLWVIFQDYKLLYSKTVWENVSFAMEVCWYSDDEIYKKVPEVLSEVWLLEQKDKLASELSWWEKQRVAIARALAHDPEIIIADEPTWNLDPETASQIIDIFYQISKDKKTFIIATHDEKIVNKAGKRVVSFDSWKIISDEKKGVFSIPS